MLENKQVNSLMSSLSGLPRLYDVMYRTEETTEQLAKNVTLEEANVVLNNLEYQDNAYIISTNFNINYSMNIEETLKAVSRLAQKDNHTFVLSFEDGEWRAAYGDYKDCEEYRGANPAYCSCMALLKFMGKV